MRNMNCQRMNSSPQNNNGGCGMHNIDGGYGSCRSNCPTDRSGCNSSGSNCPTDRSGCSSSRSNCPAGRDRYDANQQMYGNCQSGGSSNNDGCGSYGRGTCNRTNDDGCGSCRPGRGADGGGRGPCNRINDENCNECSSRHNDPLLGMPVAIGYVPWQQWSCLFDMETGLNKGTMFPALSLPFRGCIPNCRNRKGGVL